MTTISCSNRVKDGEGISQMSREAHPLLAGRAVVGGKDGPNMFSGKYVIKENKLNKK